MKLPPKYLAAAILILITPVLTELLTGNQPAQIFFQPANLFMMFLTYGLPVLFLRELAIRWQLGWIGIIILGLAYGIFNEGIAAKTLLASVPPVTTFAHYGYFLGVNLSWTAVILIWHAFHSVLYPIFLTHYLFPKQQSEAWLKNKTLLFLSIFNFFSGALAYFLANPNKTSPIYFFVFNLAILILLVVAKKFKSHLENIPHEGKSGFIGFSKGFAFAVIYLVSFALTAFKIAPIIFILFLAIWATITIHLFRRLSQTHFILFALGDYLAFVIFSLIKTTPERLVVVPLMAVIFIFSAIMINRKCIKITRL